MQSFSTVFRFWSFLIFLRSNFRTHSTNEFVCVVHAERASELAGDGAHVFHADDAGRDEASLHMRGAWFTLHRVSRFLLQRLRHGRSPEASHGREIWLLGLVGSYGLHCFIWGQSSSLIDLPFAFCNYRCLVSYVGCWMSDQCVRISKVLGFSVCNLTVICFEYASKLLHGC